MLSDDYECDGQLELTDYLKSQIKNGQVMDLTSWINSQGRAQYTQIGDVVAETYERCKDSDELVARLTNAVSVYVLRQSIGYMQYLKKNCDVEGE